MVLVLVLVMAQIRSTKFCGIAREHQDTEKEKKERTRTRVGVQMQAAAGASCILGHHGGIEGQRHEGMEASPGAGAEVQV